MSYRVPPPFAKSEVTSSTNADWNVATNASLALTLDAALVRLNNPTNLLPNTKYTLYIIQGSTGGYEAVFGTEVVALTTVSCDFAWQSGTTSRCTTAGDISSLIVGSTVAFENASSNIWNCGNMAVTDVQAGYFEFTHPYVTDASNDVTSTADVSATYSVYTFTDGKPTLDTRPNAVNAFECYSGDTSELLLNYLGSTSTELILTETYTNTFLDDFIEPAKTNPAFSVRGSAYFTNYPTGYSPRVGIFDMGIYAASSSSWAELSRINEARILSDSTFSGEFEVKLDYSPAAVGEEYYFAFGLYTNSLNNIYIQAEDTWKLVTEESGTQTIVDSGIPVAYGLGISSGWSTLRIKATDSLVEFYVNSTTLIGSITTNIPSTALYTIVKLQRRLGASGSYNVSIYANKIKTTWQSKT